LLELTLVRVDPDTTSVNSAMQNQQE